MHGQLEVAEAAARGVRLLPYHPAIASISEPVPYGETGALAVAVGVRVALPNAWNADGASPNGVRSVEAMTFIFPPEYPLRAPLLYLRRDFDRSLAHMQPGSLKDNPEPCIVDGLPSELLQERGLFGILDQVALWLENAALGRLIDRAQGWEPVRRDSFHDTIVADASHLRGLVTRQAGRAVFRFDFLRYQPVEGRPAYYGQIQNEPRLALNAKTIGDLFGSTDLTGSPTLARGRSVGILVWPGRHPSGKPVVANVYQPETVVDVASLMERATTYGCEEPLREALNWLGKCLKGLHSDFTFPLVIILSARRPFALIGSDSPIELCPYVVEIGAPTLLRAAATTGVQPAAHREAISLPLLRRLSGIDPTAKSFPWALLGAGSLGSKIGLHLARSGQAPAVVIDSAWLSPHNAARHALMPVSGNLQVSWLVSKATGLVEAINGLGQPADAFVVDGVQLLADPAKRRTALPARIAVLVNATASLVVREALASAPAPASLPRLIETSLFAAGQVGLMTIEGPDRNPDTGDLISETYARLLEESQLASLVLTGESAVTRHTIGEGCGSATMAISDAQISIMAAPMAESIGRTLLNGLPTDGGRLLIGVLNEDRMSVVWRHYALPACTTIAVEYASSWNVHIGTRADEQIIDEVARWPTVETGGIVLGRMSEAARTFYVVDVFPAPEDSRRAIDEFVLGTAGLRTAIDSYAESAGGSLYCLGTWHSHLRASGPSWQDRATAVAVGLTRLVPSVLLIHTPAGYRALLAEAAGGESPRVSSLRNQKPA